MSEMVYKAGLQSDKDPYEFVMSTADRDRVGDIVMQDWDLRDFKQNPIALYAHDHRMPIGRWEKVRVEAEKLMGRLVLASKGTSEFIDTLHSLVEQRILKAVSVGFLPEKWDPIDEDDPYAGYVLSNNSLMECSLCAVPANPNALSLAKDYFGGLSITDRVRLLKSQREVFHLPARRQVDIGGANSQSSASSAMSGENTAPAIERAKKAILAANQLMRQN